MIANNTAIAAINTRRKTLLPYALFQAEAKIVKNGSERNARASGDFTSDPTVSAILNVGFCPESVIKRERKMRTVLKQTNSEPTERGADKPKIKPTSFTKSPKIIRKAMLKPKEKATISSLCNFSFSSLTMIKPGTNDKKIKQYPCLIKGISNSITNRNAICSSNKVIKVFPDSKLKCRDLKLVSYHLQ